MDVQELRVSAVSGQPCPCDNGALPIEQSSSRRGNNAGGLHQSTRVPELPLRAPNARPRELTFPRVLGNLVGQSPAMQEVFSMILGVASSSAPVLITGQTGTGKELVAREIHNCSPRRKGPF